MDLSLQRFVFVLGDADSLRERIAGISFVGIGFGRCECGGRVIPNRPAGGDDPKNNQEKVVVDCEGDPGGAQSPRQACDIESGFRKFDVLQAQLYSMQSQPAF